MKKRRRKDKKIDLALFFDDPPVIVELCPPTPPLERDPRIRYLKTNARIVYKGILLSIARVGQIGHSLAVVMRLLESTVRHPPKEVQFKLGEFEEDVVDAYKRTLERLGREEKSMKEER